MPLPIEQVIDHLAAQAPLATQSLQELNNELDRLRDHNALELLDTILERTLTAIDAIQALKQQAHS